MERVLGGAIASHQQELALNPMELYFPYAACFLVLDQPRRDGGEPLLNLPGFLVGLG